MKKLWQKIRNLGVDEQLDDDTARRLRITNSVNLVLVVVTTMMFIDGISLSWPPEVFILGGIIVAFATVPFFLNAYKKINLSRFFMVIIANLFMLLFVILLGPKMHYQYNLIVIMVLPFLFLGRNFAKLRAAFALFTIAIWVYLEWHFTQFDPVYPLVGRDFTYVRTNTDFFVFVMLFAEIYILLFEGERHIKLVAEKSKELEQQNLVLEERTKQLEETNAHLDRFSYFVSHDLKAPMANVLGYVDLIKSEYANKFDDDLTNLFGEIEKGTSKSRDLIQEIFEYSTISYATIKKEIIHIDKLIDEALSIVKIPAHIQTEKSIDCSEINVVKTQLLQVLTNLIGNAVKYHNKETGSISITADVLPDAYLKICIADDGPGIAAKYHETIFEMFGTAHDKVRQDSTGVGLAIVKKLIDLNGGLIQIDSELGKGSRFTFTWKL